MVAWRPDVDDVAINTVSASTEYGIISFSGLKFEINVLSENNGVFAAENTKITYLFLYVLLLIYVYVFDSSYLSSRRR